jgi:hypothetical protein
MNASTRVSTEYGLDQEFNSLDAQHEAAEAYIRSQAQMLDPGSHPLRRRWLFRWLDRAPPAAAAAGRHPGPQD